MSLAVDRDFPGLAFEDISTGVFASGFGQVGDGRSFSFRIERATLLVEVYRPRLTSPVPQAEDVVAIAERSLVEIDVNDERTLRAVVRDAISEAVPVPRPPR
ncbi:MAG: hypothetical protein ACSLE6_17785 [Mycobacterium sp.]